MLDIEFMSELLIGVMHGPQGGSSKIIDEYYEQYEDYEDEFPEQHRTQKLFKEVLAIIQSIFPKIKETRWSNKTDFYTLFVGLASLLRKYELTGGGVRNVRKALEKFAEDTDLRLADEHATVSKTVINYVRAVEKGANDKKRRANRHAALLAIIGEYFKPRKKSA
ncbi:MAG: hypothetical protein A2V66_02965 [Ignavibacteria bacterium RBG_13_36_8]|nr:MAG: hypothetical protein A2V66_02965 [Ignavibacteria bacterium RBG_13_36_8]